MKYIVLTRTVFVWELSEDMYKSDQYQEEMDSYMSDQEEIANKYGMEYLLTESDFIQKEKHSVSRCTSCGAWTIDREKNSIKEVELELVRDGASVDDKLLCYECLPAGHRWSWS